MQSWSRPPTGMGHVTLPRKPAAQFRAPAVGGQRDVLQLEEEVCGPDAKGVSGEQVSRSLCIRTASMSFRECQGSHRFVSAKWA